MIPSRMKGRKSCRRLAQSGCSSAAAGPYTGRCEEGRVGQRQDPSTYTGHSSSFHAISQNIHSYRELITKASSMRRFSSFPAFLAH